MNSTVTEASTSTSTDTPSTFNTVFLYKYVREVFLISKDLCSSIKIDLYFSFLPLLLVVLVICVSTTIIYCYIASKVRAAQKSQSQLFLTSRSLNNSEFYRFFSPLIANYWVNISKVYLGSFYVGCFIANLNLNQEQIFNFYDYASNYSFKTTKKYNRHFRLEFRFVLFRFISSFMNQ